MKKRQSENKVRSDGYIEVPTYLFPQSEEYGEDIVPEMKVERKKK